MKRHNGCPGDTVIALHYEINSYPIPFILIWSKLNWMDNNNIKSFGLYNDFLNLSYQRIR